MDSNGDKQNTIVSWSSDYTVGVGSFFAVHVIGAATVAQSGALGGIMIIQYLIQCLVQSMRFRFVRQG